MLMRAESAATDSGRARDHYVSHLSRELRQDNGRRTETNMGISNATSAMNDGNVERRLREENADGRDLLITALGPAGASTR